MSSILYEMLTSIIEHKSNSRDLGNYSTLAYLISEKKAQLSKEDLSLYIVRVKEEFDKLISHQILNINSSMLTKINTCDNYAAQGIFRRLYNKICVNTQISSKETPSEILLILLINTNKLEELLSYIQELSKYIIHTNLQNGQIKAEQTITPQVTQIRVINQNIYDYMINSLFDSGLITEDANRGGKNSHAYKVTNSGRNFFNDVAQNLNTGRSTIMPNIFNNNIMSVNQLSQGDNNSNHNTNIQIMDSQILQSIINDSGSTLTEEEKNQLLALNNNPTFASRLWELLNSTVNGAASGIASSIFR